MDRRYAFGGRGDGEGHGILGVRNDEVGEGGDAELKGGRRERDGGRQGDVRDRGK